ncbi:MAG: exodeoxyribonuclease III [Betaproteobacteria bacterium]|nr:exodeoxyribonuclease III [Betaproteobacteria bacterium]
MKIATWNVNSLKVRLPHVLDWLATQQPDALCLQELKIEDAVFPRAEIEAAGYQALFLGQKTYNGVAILSRIEATDVVRNIPDFADEQKRVLACALGDVRVICCYVPNGQAVGADKYEYKLRWLGALSQWLKAELARYPKLIVVGDYNIAPDDRDVHDPKQWAGQILCSEPERAAYQRLLTLGLHDSFRLFEQADKSFTWWDYRMNGFKRNLGLRIDHILVSDAIVKQCRSCAIDLAPRKLERPSDHAPVYAVLDL